MSELAGQQVHTGARAHDAVSPAGFRERRRREASWQELDFELILKGGHYGCSRGEGEKAFQKGLWRGSIRDH